MQALQFMRKMTRSLFQMNTPRRSSGNVRHNYDLSGKLYDLFLDHDRQYSCAYFEMPAQTLEEAQLAKKPGTLPPNCALRTARSCWISARLRWAWSVWRVF